MISQIKNFIFKVSIFFLCIFCFAANSRILADDIALDAWTKCATLKANNFGVSVNLNRDSHLIMGECASYELNYLVSLSQTGISRHEVFSKESQVETDLFNIIHDILLKGHK